MQRAESAAESALQARPSARHRLTNSLVRNAVASHRPGEWRRIWDEAVPELFVRLTPRGHASFGLRYPRLGCPPGDHTIGPALTLTVELARSIARERLGRVYANGVDFNQERRDQVAAVTESKKDKLTLSALIELYLEQTEMADTTLSSRKSLLGRWIGPAIGQVLPDDVKEPMIRKLQARVMEVNTEERAHIKKNRGGVRTARLIRSFLNTVYRWGIGFGHCQTNPAAFDDSQIDARPEKRMRALTEHRVRVIWNALCERERLVESRAAALGIKLAFITLQRPNEIIKAHRDDIEFDEPATWRPGPNRHKTWPQVKKPLFVPLTPPAQQAFQDLMGLSQNLWCLPGSGRRRGSHSANRRLHDLWVQVRDELVAAGKLDDPDLDLYDVKRFGRTYLEQKLKVESKVAEMVISHKIPDNTSTTYVVDDADELNAIREAHSKWTDALMEMVGFRKP